MSGHHHHDHHAPASYNRAFAIGILLNVGFVAIEATFGFLTNSLALIADAGHNLSDVLGLVLAWGASWLVSRKPTPRFTYGLRRSSIYAALINAIVLLVTMGAIAVEAIDRFRHPVAIEGNTMIGVALVGIVINGITALMFASGRDRDINLKGAFLHMAGDALVSLGVVVAGIVITFTNWLWIDPTISLIIAAIIVVSTWQLLHEATSLALDAVPPGIPLQEVRLYLNELPGVVAVHDLHVWAMSTTEPALTVHLIMPTGHPGDGFLTRIHHELHDRFGIEHSTLQIEQGTFTACQQSDCCNP